MEINTDTGKHGIPAVRSEEISMRLARPDRRKGEMATIIVSAIISAITSKIVATCYFEKADGYVKEMCEMTKKSNQHTLAILHKLQENPKQKEVS